MKARRWHKNRRLEPSDEPPSQLDLKYLSYVRMENVEADLPPLWQAAGLRLLAGEQLLTAADFSLARQAAFGGKRGVLYLTSLRLVWIGRPFNWIWDIFLGKLTVIDLPLGLIDSCSVSHRWLVKCIVVKRESRGREPASSPYIGFCSPSLIRRSIWENGQPQLTASRTLPEATASSRARVSPTPDPLGAS